jgi:hypothetical protein
MRSDFKSGDLAFIPSEVMMLKICDAGAVKNYLKTSKPKNALILAVHEDTAPGFTKVYYDGDVWFVKNTDIYGERNVDCETC